MPELWGEAMARAVAEPASQIRTNYMLPLSLATAAIVITLIVGLGLLWGPTIGTPEATPTPDASPTSESAAPVGTWTPTGDLVTPHWLHTATLLLDGRVLVAGSDLENASAAELYDPSTRSWAATQSMTNVRYRHTATLLPDGTVLVAGGIDPVPDAQGSGGTTPLDSAELYDPNSGSWTTAPNLAAGRGAHTATLLPDGRVLVAGGISVDHGSGGPPEVSAELYDPRNGSWTATGSMITPHAYHAAVLLPDGTVLVAGGFMGGGAGTAEVYDPSTGTWTATEPMVFGHAEASATLLLDGRVLFAASESATRSAELYDPITGRWAATPDMTQARYGAPATLLPDGRVLVVGSIISGTRPDEGLGAELYDPGTGTWTIAANMTTPRHGHTATLLDDGTVLVAGGDDRSAETYDPGDQ